MGEEGESGFSDRYLSSDKFLQPIAPTPTPETVAVPPIETYSDSAGEVGGNGKRPRTCSFDKEHGLLDSEFKNVKSEASTMTDGTRLLSGTPSADKSLSNKEMKKMHDAVDSYLKSSFCTGNYGELLEKLNGTGIWENHLRAVVRAKAAKRKRGEPGDVKDLCISSSLADEGLTMTDIFKLERFLRDNMPKARNFETWLREVKMQGVNGAYLRALFRNPRTSFNEVLELMKKEGIPLKTFAMVVTETSYLEVMQQSSRDGAERS